MFVHDVIDNLEEQIDVSGCDKYSECNTNDLYMPHNCL